MPQQKVFKAFSQIIGQAGAIQFLEGVIAKGKIPHAYLFAGIPGIGKTTTALALSRAVNCQEQLPEEGCGRCKSCRQLEGGNFPDLALIEPDGQNVKIGQIRDLNRTLSFKPLSGRYRVSILEQAELMTDEAANALLKTLEEPPANNILILNVTEPLALFPTIVSRCQKVLFRPIPVRDIAEWLTQNLNLNDEKALVLARISEGSLGRAIRMCEGDFFKQREDYLSSIIQLPGMSSGQALEMAITYARMEKKGASRVREKGDAGLTDLLSIWKSWYRDLLLLKVDCPADLLINVDFSHKLKSISRSSRIEGLMESLFLVDQSQRDLLRSRNVDLMMEHTVLSLKRLTGHKTAH